jgi:hypothetical protein
MPAPFYISKPEPASGPGLTANRDDVWEVESLPEGTER